MLKKNLLQYLAIVFIVAACWGLYADLYYTTGTNINRIMVRDAFTLANLGIISTSGFEDIITLTVTNVIFYVLLLLGSIFYLTSSGRETRLLRTALGIMFLSNLLSLCTSVSFLLFVKNTDYQKFIIILYNVIVILKHAVLIYFSQRALRYFNQTKEFDLEVHEYNDSTVSYSVAAKIGQRITHSILDCLITLLVFSPIVAVILFRLGKHSLSFSDHLEYNQQDLLAIFVVCRIIYYIIFENFFASTPAKMMTETRVINSDGDRPSFPQVLGRTVSRLIPLEGLSFLTSAGLHDRLSSTNVVSEKRTGLSGSNYYMILFVVPILILGYSSIKEAIIHHYIVSEVKAENKKFDDDLHSKLEHIGTNDFLTLQVINNFNSTGNGSPSIKLLKAERVTADSITFSFVKVSVRAFNPMGQLAAEQAYKAGHDTLPRITVARRDLKKALLGQYQSYTSQDSTVKGIKVKGTLYAIRSINTYF